MVHRQKQKFNAEIMCRSFSQNIWIYKSFTKVSYLIKVSILRLKNTEQHEYIYVNLWSHLVFRVIWH